MVENCQGGSGYSAETPGTLGFKGLMVITYSWISELLLGCNSHVFSVSIFSGKPKGNCLPVTELAELRPTDAGHRLIIASDVCSPSSKVFS